MRPYTISSSPPRSLQLLHHHQAGAGRAGFQLAARQTLKEGQELPVHGPVGLFNAIDFSPTRCCSSPAGSASPR